MPHVPLLVALPPLFPQNWTPSRVSPTPKMAPQNKLQTPNCHEHSCSLLKTLSSQKMTHSAFEYVRKFELDDALLPGTYIVVRVDGRGFSRFTSAHGYLKPNDARGLALMNQCAASVMREWGDIVVAFGESDEYSFVLPPSCGVFGRRSAKLATGIASLFASSFVFYWPRFFADARLLRPPSFDARCVVYPNARIVSDYLRWRQVDTHINTLHNEAFWALVQKGAWLRWNRPAGARPLPKVITSRPTPCGLLALWRSRRVTHVV